MSIELGNRTPVTLYIQSLVVYIFLFTELIIFLTVLNITQQLLLSIRISVNLVNVLTNIHSVASVSDKEQLQLMLTNLHKCLLEYFTEKDREAFLCKTLPRITQLASDLPKLIPPDGVPFLKQEKGMCSFLPSPMNIHCTFLARSVSLSRQLIASLLANGFLCAFPVSIEQSSSSEGPGLNFDQFFSVFSWEDK